jgi:hypothetical protein
MVRRGNSHGLYSSSTVSEPEGLIRVWRSLSKRGFKHATVWLDHGPLVWACRSRRPHAWHYNRALETLNSTEARSVGFVAGCRNPADNPSRGEAVPALVMEGLQSLLGGTIHPYAPTESPVHDIRVLRLFSLFTYLRGNLDIRIPFGVIWRSTFINTVFPKCAMNM